MIPESEIRRGMGRLAWADAKGYRAEAWIDATSDQWLEAFGTESIDLWEKAVERWCSEKPNRPTISDFRQYMLGLAGRTVDLQVEACDECLGSGWRTFRVLYRRRGTLREDEGVAACTCPRGVRHGYSDHARLFRETYDRLSATPTVTRDSGQDGLVAWEFTHKDWTRWSPRVYIDEGAAWERRRRADELCGRVLAALDAGAEPQRLVSAIAGRR